MFIQMSKCRFGSRSKPKIRTILNLFFKFYFSMNYVWRLQKYWPPTPSHPASVSSPRTKGGGYTPGGEGGGGSIFLKTPDTVLYSTYVSTLASCNYGRNNLWWGWGKERQGGSIFWGFLIPSKNYTGPRKVFMSGRMHSKSTKNWTIRIKTCVRNSCEKSVNLSRLSVRHIRLSGFATHSNWNIYIKLVQFLIFGKKCPS